MEYKARYPSIKRGQVIGGGSNKLRFIDFLGHGKNGTVLRMLCVEGPLKGVMVAAKFSYDPTEPERKERFDREIAILKRLRHPHIVEIMDEGRYVDIKGDDYSFYAMEYQPRNLERLINSYPRGLPCEEVLRLCIQIASGLVCFHNEGVVHRDIKPANILFDGSNARLADFGLAKDRDEGGKLVSGISLPGKKLGPKSHISPEQFRYWKKESEVEPGKPSDVYQFGLVMYQLITAFNPNVVSRWDEGMTRKPTTAFVRKLDGTLVRQLTSMVKTTMQDDCERRPTASVVLDGLLDTYDQFDGDHRQIHGKAPGAE